MVLQSHIHALAERMVLRLAGEALVSAASAVPVDTGRLRGSLSVRSAGLSASVVSDCPYAAFVELGSGRSAARPFLLPALRAAQSCLPEIVAKEGVL